MLFAARNQMHARTNNARIWVLLGNGQSPKSIHAVTSVQEALMLELTRSIWKLRNLMLVLTLFWAAPAVSQQPAEAPKPAEEVYKNIQVLKGLPAPQLMEVMHSFAHSLGVKCTFCHVEGAFEKDDKPQKQTARKMILMAQGINKDDFGDKRRVTCWTCHRGATEPESKPPQSQTVPVGKPK